MELYEKEATKNLLCHRKDHRDNPEMAIKILWSSIQNG